MYPYRYSLLASLLLFFLPLAAQNLGHSVVASAGDYFSVANTGNLHFTLGEISVSRTENGPILEQGFHHGLTSGITTSTWSAPRVTVRLAAFPNPTADFITLTGDWGRQDRIEIRDIFGRLLHGQLLPPERAPVDLSPYPAGTYFLTLTRNGQPVAGARVVRQ